MFCVFTTTAYIDQCFPIDFICPFKLEIKDAYYGKPIIHFMTYGITLTYPTSTSHIYVVVFHYQLHILFNFPN